MLPTIVVVDAHPDIRALLQRALTLAGFGVRTAVDASTALQALAAAPADLLVIDGDQPHPDVQDLIDRAQAAVSGMPVLVLVAERESVDLDGAVVLTKPFALATLTRQAQHLLAGKPQDRGGDEAAGEPTRWCGGAR